MFLAVVIIGYLLGAVPSALIIGRGYGIPDIRDFGSHNMGTMNVYRTAGGRAALLTLAADVGKGLMACLMARWLSAEAVYVYWAAGAAVLGHMFPIYVGFRGGKSIAVYSGTILFIEPGLLFPIFVSWLLCYFLTRKTSLSSIIGFGLLPPAAVFALGMGWGALFYFTLGAGILIIGKHTAVLMTRTK